MSQFYELYKNLGNEKFSASIGQVAPYFATIFPQFQKFEPGYCEIILPNRKEVHNHIGTVHAIAMCNAAELVAGLTTEISIPSSHRWLPIGMTTQYLALAKTDLIVKTLATGVDWEKIGDIVVPAEAYDQNGVKVFRADITMKTSLKK